MVKIRAEVIILSALVLSCLLLGSALTFVALPADRIFTVVLMLVGMLTILVVTIATRGRTSDIPAGSAGIITSLGQQGDPIAGPTKVKYYPLFQDLHIQNLLQKPTNITCECNTKGHIHIQVNVTVVWELCPEAISKVARKEVDPGEMIKRLVEAQLLIELCNFTHEQVNHQAFNIACDLKRYLNQPEYSDKLYNVKYVLITHVKPPTNILHAASENEVERNKYKPGF